MITPAEAPPERPTLLSAVATISQSGSAKREVRVDFPETRTPSLVTTTFTSPNWRGDPLAGPSSQPHHTSVDAIGRHEHDAKLAAVEARLDGKIVKIEGLLERVADNLSGVSSTVSSLSEEIRGARTHTTNTTVAVVVAVIATALGLYQAMSGSNSALLGAFQAGISVGGMDGPVSTASGAKPAEVATPTPAPNPPK